MNMPCFKGAGRSVSIELHDCCALTTLFKSFDAFTEAGFQSCLSPNGHPFRSSLDALLGAALFPFLRPHRRVRPLSSTLHFLMKSVLMSLSGPNPSFASHSSPIFERRRVLSNVVAPSITTVCDNKSRVPSSSLPTTPSASACASNDGPRQVTIGQHKPIPLLPVQAGLWTLSISSPDETPFRPVAAFPLTSSPTSTSQRFQKTEDQSIKGPLDLDSSLYPVYPMQDVQTLNHIDDGIDNNWRNSYVCPSLDDLVHSGGSKERSTVHPRSDSTSSISSVQSSITFSSSHTSYTHVDSSMTLDMNPTEVGADQSFGFPPHTPHTRQDSLESCQCVNCIIPDTRSRPITPSHPVSRSSEDLFRHGSQDRARLQVPESPNAVCQSLTSSPSISVTTLTTSADTSVANVQQYLQGLWISTMESSPIDVEGGPPARFFPEEPLDEDTRARREYMHNLLVSQLANAAQSG